MKPETIYKNNRIALKNEMIENYGYIFCQNCKTSHSFKFETHHIFWRSEKPGHKNLHHKDNLIIVCKKCHDKFHAEKTYRNKLVEERNLIKLFE